MGLLTETQLDHELALLSMLLRAPAQITQCGTLAEHDFEKPVHGLLYETIRAAVTEQQTGVDILVISDRLRRAGLLARFRNGADLHEWYALPWAAGTIGWYAGKVRKRAQLREMHKIGVRIQQAAREGTEADDLEQALDHAAALLLELHVLADTAIDVEQPVAGVSSWEAFVDECDDEHAWVVPGLLEAQDRMVVVSTEGAGKSTLARMLAIMTAAGRHVFDANRVIPAMRTLYVDLENPTGLVRRKGRPLVTRARNLGVWSDGAAFRWTKPGGLDIRRPADARLLERVVAETRPALITLGPLYKAYRSHGDGPEETAAEAAAVLDRLRERFGVALWLETHAPLDQGGSRSLRPVGSGLWSRWPEFGMVLRKDRKKGRDLLHVDWFRGHRDERSWPLALVRDTTWPWRPVWDAEEIKMLGGVPL